MISDMIELVDFWHRARSETDESERGLFAISRGRADLRHHGAVDGRSRSPA